MPARKQASCSRTVASASLSPSKMPSNHRKSGSPQEYGKVDMKRMSQSEEARIKVERWIHESPLGRTEEALEPWNYPRMSRSKPPPMPATRQMFPSALTLRGNMRRGESLLEMSRRDEYVPQPRHQHVSPRVRAETFTPDLVREPSQRFAHSSQEASYAEPEPLETPVGFASAFPLALPTIAALRSSNFQSMPGPQEVQLLQYAYQPGYGPLHQFQGQISGQVEQEVARCCPSTDRRRSHVAQEQLPRLFLSREGDFSRGGDPPGREDCPSHGVYVLQGGEPSRGGEGLPQGVYVSRGGDRRVKAQSKQPRRRMAPLPDGSLLPRDGCVEPSFRLKACSAGPSKYPAASAAPELSEKREPTRETVQVETAGLSQKREQIKKTVQEEAVAFSEERQAVKEAAPRRELLSADKFDKVKTLEEEEDRKDNMHELKEDSLELLQDGRRPEVKVHILEEQEKHGWVYEVSEPEPTCQAQTPSSSSKKEDSTQKKKDLARRRKEDEDGFAQEPVPEEHPEEPFHRAGIG